MYGDPLPSSICFRPKQDVICSISIATDTFTLSMSLVLCQFSKNWTFSLAEQHPGSKMFIHTSSQ